MSTLKNQHENRTSKIIDIYAGQTIKEKRKELGLT